jgi:hypothetical protein
MSVQLLQKLDGIGTVLEKFFERQKFPLICVFSAIYALGTWVIAARKPMWNDELFTFYISRLPSISDIWAALLTGGEQIPPFFHLTTRLSLALFGVNELAIRLPQILGFWIMSLCLFRFVSRRSSALCGFVAMLFPLVTGAYDYAHEGRPYGMVLGFAGLSLLFWQMATEGIYRKFTLIGVALSIAAAVSSHYYSVLLLVPLAAGELTRSIFRQRLDLPIWVALGLGLLPLVLFIPLIHESVKQAGIFWAQPDWRSALQFYYSVLSPALLPLLIVLVLSAVYSTVHSDVISNRSSQVSITPPFHEIAAAIGFIAMPFIAFAMAFLATGAMTHRYVISSVLGFSILFAFVPRALSHGREIVGAALVISLLGGFILVEVRELRNVTEAQSRRAKTVELLQSNGYKELPIVASDLNTFTTLSQYAPRDIAERLVYLSDPQASLRHLKHSSVDQGILDLKPWFRLNVNGYQQYISSQKRFLVYGGTDPNWVWLHSELSRGNFRIEMKGRNKLDFLFLVTAKD